MSKQKTLKRITTTAVLGITTMLANAQLRTTRQHFVIPVEVVARTITASFATRGIQISSEQVKLPLDVLATEENPILEVGTVGKLGQLSTAQPGQQSASIRLRCKTAGACAPFYAIVSWQGDQQPLIAPSKLPAELPVELVAADGSVNRIAASAQAKTDRPSSLVKAGAPMTLMIEGDHAHIRLAVVSLGSGALGQKIRVSTPDRKHFYMAEVQSADSVKGSF